MRYPVLTVVFLAACAPLPDTQRGVVHAYNGQTVTIRGAFDPTDGQLAKPTPGMVEQAREVCPGATYLSATPSETHEFDWDFLYLFKC